MRSILIVVASLVVVACAPTQTSTNPNPPEERQFRTGSRLPTKEPPSTATIDVEDRRKLATPMPAGNAARGN